MVLEQGKAGYLNLRGLADYSSIAIPTLRDHIRKNGLPCFKVSGMVLVRRAEFDRWMDKFRVTRETDLKAIVDEVMEGLKAGKSDS